MKGTCCGWYLLIGVVVLAPAGFRLLTWPGVRRQTLDPEMVRAGQTLFHHEWKANDPLAGGGDGLGPVYNANSCVACHNQAGPGGGGGVEHNVTNFVSSGFRLRAVADMKRCSGGIGVEAVKVGRPSEGVVHAQAVNNCPRDTLKRLHPQLPEISQPTLPMLVSMPGMERNRIQFPGGVQLSQRNTPALFGAQLIDALPDRVLIANENKQHLKWGLASAESKDLPVGRALRLADGRIGHFGWKAQSASLSAFVQAACANELGLGNPGQAQPRPLGNPDYRPVALDLTAKQCDQITDFVASLSRPKERLPESSYGRNQVVAGKQLFHRVGCADCHTPNVAGINGLYSDLLLHDMGQTLEGGGSYNDPPPQIASASPGEGPNPGEWRTPPLWGVADSAPYLHDGRARTLEEAIALHKGQADRSARNFAVLSKAEQTSVVAFLQTLRAP